MFWLSTAGRTAIRCSFSSTIAQTQGRRLESGLGNPCADQLAANIMLQHSIQLSRSKLGPCHTYMANPASAIATIMEKMLFVPHHYAADAHSAHTVVADTATCPAQAQSNAGCNSNQAVWVPAGLPLLTSNCKLLTNKLISRGDCEPGTVAPTRLTQQCV